MAQETVGFNITADSKEAKKAIKDIVIYAQEVSKKLNEALSVSKGASASSEVGKLRKEMGITTREVEKATKAFSMYKTQLGLVKSLEAKRSAIINDPERQKAQNKVYKARYALKQEQGKESPDADKIAKLEQKLSAAEQALAPFEEKIAKINGQIAKWNDNLEKLKPTAQEFVDTYSKALGPAQQIIDKVNGAASATDGLAGKADNANTGFDKTGQAAQEAANAVDGLTTKEQQANDEKAKTIAADTQEGESLKELLVTLAQYRAELDQVSQAGKDTADIEQRIADTSAKVEEKLKMPNAGEGIAAVVRQLRELKEAKSAIEKAGMPVAMDSEYNKIVVSIERCKQSINDYMQSLRSTNAEHRAAGASGSSFGANVASAAKLAKKGLVAIPALLKSVKSGFSGLTKVVNKVKSSFDGMARNMRSNFKHMITSITKYVLGFRSLFFLVRRLRKYIGEGIKNMAQFEGGNNHVNESITRLLSSLLYLKNAWATAFSPILQFVTPILEKLIDDLAAVGNAFSRFIGSITGQTSVFQAVKVSAADYAKSLDSAGGSAGKAADKTKKLTDRLAAFDDLNVLGKDNDPDATGSGGGGGGADAYTPDPNEMFKIIDVEDWSQKLKDAFANADLTEIGQIVGEKLTDILSNINWEELKEKAYNLGKSIITFFNGALSDPALWEVAGQTFAEGLNTLGTLVQGILENNQVDWGGGLATLVTSFFDSFDEELFKTNLETFAQQLVDNINSFFSGILEGDSLFGDVSTMTEGLTTALVTLITGIDWAQIAEAAYGIADAILAGIQEGLQNSDNPILQSLGGVIEAFRGALETLLPIITPILEVVGQLVEAILPIISTLLPPIAEIISTLATAILPLISAALEVVMPFIETLVDALLPVLQSVIEAIAPLFSDIATVLLPLLDEYLEIISPLLDLIIELFLELSPTLGQTISAFVQLFAQALRPALAILKPLIQILVIVLNCLMDLLMPILDLIPPILELISVAIEPFISVLELVANIAGTMITAAFSLMAGAIEVILMPAIGIIKLAIGELGLVMGTLATIMDDTIGTMTTGWNGLADAIKGVANSIIGIIEGMVNNIIGGINKLLGGIEDIGELAESAGIDVPKITKISTVSLPRLAQGAVIPPNKEFMAVLGDQSHGTNIEAPLDTIKQAVAEELSAQIGVLENGFADVVAAINNKDLNIGDKQIGQANARYTARQNLIRGTSF